MSIKDATPRCPRCRNQLVERRGKRGTFWGCSSFPRCSYRRDTAHDVYDPTAGDGNAFDHNEAEAFYDAFLWDVGDR